MKIVALAVAALALVATASAPASAAVGTVPCWRTVILDWGDDGKVDKPYPTHCYRQALRHLDTDLQIYSSAHDEIERALAASILASKPPAAGSRSARLAAWPEGRRFQEATPAVQKPLVPTLSNRLELLLERKKSSTPVPLFVLGGLALLLLAAGAGGLVTGKRRERQS